MGFEWECESEVMDNRRKGFLSFKCQSLLCLVVILVDGLGGIYFQPNGKLFDCIVVSLVLDTARLRNECRSLSDNETTRDRLMASQRTCLFHCHNYLGFRNFENICET
jgi:hypothetical protein